MCEQTVIQQAAIQQAVVVRHDAGRGSFGGGDAGLAEELRADAIKVRLERLAESARIRVDRVSATPRPEARNSLVGLTTREREILEYVVAGRTYGEIARALVIGEKTVSSHISNLLRKTGTSNRVDLSRLATSAATSRNNLETDAVTQINTNA